MKEVLAAFTPNQAISKNVLKLIIGVQVAAFFLIWLTSPFVFLPSMSETWQAFWGQWDQGLGGELLVSMYANLEAIGIATIISLGLAYLTTLAGFRPVVNFLSRLRFLSMVGLSFAFTVMTKTGYQLKISMLVFSISVFFVTGMMDVVDSVPKEQYDLARTLGMKPWRVVWEVVVLGQIDKAFDVLRQNAAIGWMMLTMVESMVKSEGGIGAMLTTANRHFYLSAILAIQIAILLMGLLQDYLIGAAKRLFCPYSQMTTEKS